jgi:hypothetical protein
VHGGVLGQVVDDEERVSAAVTEPLGHGAGGVRRRPLQPGRRLGGSDDEHAALGRAEGAHRVDHPTYRGRLLADSDIHTDDVVPPLIDDGVDGDCRLPGLRVADDQLPLAATERDHRIDGKQTGLERRAHRIAVDDRRCWPVDRIKALGGRLDTKKCVNPVGPDPGSRPIVRSAPSTVAT